MANGLKVLNDRIARLRILVDLPEDAAPVVAQSIAKEIDRQIAAGTDPDGNPWAPRKADGGKPLTRAAKDIVVGVVGKTVIVRIRAKHLVLHHFGFSRGKVQRQVIPIGKIPDRWATAIRASVSKRFGDIMGRA